LGRSFIIFLYGPHLGRHFVRADPANNIAVERAVPFEPFDRIGAANDLLDVSPHGLRPEAVEMFR
jgi:hypothetical protein